MRVDLGENSEEKMLISGNFPCFLKKSFLQPQKQANGPGCFQEETTSRGVRFRGLLRPRCLGGYGLVGRCPQVRGVMSGGVNVHGIHGTICLPSCVEEM